MNINSNLVNAALVASYLAEMTGNWLVWGIDPTTGKALQFSIPTDEVGDCWRTPCIWGVTPNTSKNPLVSTSVVGSYQLVNLDTPDVVQKATITEEEARFVACQIRQMHEGTTVAEAARAVSDNKFEYVGAEYGVRAF